MKAKRKLGALALLVMSAAVYADNHSVRVGYIADYWGTSITAIAEEQNLWEKHGLDAELNVFTNGPIQVQAFGAGSLDFGYIGPGALWLPASGKAKVVAINSVGYADRVIAQPGINSMQELKGKRVGVPEGTSGDMLLRMALKENGMSIDDIEFIRMDPSTAVSAFASGQIDAAAIWYPMIDTIRKARPELVEIASNRAFYPAQTFPSAFIGRNEFVENNPEATDAMIAVIKEAQDWRTQHPEEAVKVTAKFLGIDPENLATEAENGLSIPSAELSQLSEEGTVYNWLDTMANMYVEFGKLSDPIPATQYYLAEQYINTAP